MTKPDHPYNRRPQLAGKGLLPIAMNYALGTGGPSGSELPPPLTCCRCKCGAEPRRVDGVLKLDCGCRRNT